MNRAEVVRAIAACEALTKELRSALKAEARAEFEEQQTIPTWRLPGITVSGSVTNDAVEVSDPAAFLEWVSRRHPSEVHTVRQVRSAWQAEFLSSLVGRGDPPATEDGEVVPGLAFRAGGEFRAVSVIPSSATKRALADRAADMVAGRLPLALPTGGDDA